MNTEFETTQTVAGSQVRIYSRDTGPDGRIHGAYLEQQSGNWYPASWLQDGHVHPEKEDGYQPETGLDLIESQFVGTDRDVRLEDSPHEPPPSVA